jgi:uncharacterized BrkB/YihY/UPF0761 family membrane protein
MIALFSMLINPGIIPNFLLVKELGLLNNYGALIFPTMISAFNLIVMRAFAGLPILLIWLYVMANVIVFGAEVNWWRARGRYESVRAQEEAAGLA